MNPSNVTKPLGLNAVYTLILSQIKIAFVKIWEFRMLEFLQSSQNSQILYKKCLVIEPFLGFRNPISFEKPIIDPSSLRISCPSNTRIAYYVTIPEIEQPMPIPIQKLINKHMYIHKYLCVGLHSDLLVTTPSMVRFLPHGSMQILSAI